jgi:hypothetical protein
MPEAKADAAFEAESTTSELARILGVSHTAVQKAEKRGRITPVRFLVTDRRRSPIYNTEQAVSDWAANTNAANKRTHKAGGRPRLDGQPTKPRPDLPSKPLADKLVPGVGGAGGAAGAPEPDGEINYNKANAREKHYKALIAQLEYEQKVGLLVPIVDVAKEVDREYSRVRARLLAIPSVLAHDLALSDSIAECRTLMETAINDALNELTADAASPHADD